MTLIGSKINSYNKTELSGGSKKKIRPTDIGIIVNDFLIENFNQIINYDFTAQIILIKYRKGTRDGIT
ncbi:MAG: hypothetical protein ACFIN3_00340 [Candidatus Walczuchella monophlebidarum]